MSLSTEQHAHEGDSSYLGSPEGPWSVPEKGEANQKRNTREHRDSIQSELHLYLVDLILVEWYVSVRHLLSNLHQMLLDVLHNDIPTLVRQDLTNHVAGEEEDESRFPKS